MPAKGILHSSFTSRAQPGLLMSFFKQVLAIIRGLFGSNSARVNTVVAKLPRSPSSSTMADQKELVPAFASFPTTQPAMTIKVSFSQQYMCGDIFTGSTLVAVPFSDGTLESVGDFEPKLQFKVNNGIDWFRIDADKSYGRLSVKAIATDAENRSICVILDGLTPLNESVMPLIMGDPNAKNYPFGFGVEHMKIEAGHEVYKPLEGMMFAASQRFVKEDNGLTSVELRIARIIPGTGME